MYAANERLQVPVSMPVAAPAQTPTAPSVEHPAQAQPIAPTPITAPRAIPSRSPSGIQELQKYDEPAYKRRDVAGFGNGVKINRFSDNTDQPNDEQTNGEALNKPAFLRRIMD
jgi:hypothetical protein